MCMRSCNGVGSAAICRLSSNLSAQLQRLRAAAILKPSSTADFQLGGTHAAPLPISASNLLAWLQAHRVKEHSDTLWGIQSTIQAMTTNILKYRYGQLWSRKLAYMRKEPYMHGKAAAKDSCRGDDSGGQHPWRMFAQRHDITVHCQT